MSALTSRTDYSLDAAQRFARECLATQPYQRMFVAFDNRQRRMGWASASGLQAILAIGPAFEEDAR